MALLTIRNLSVEIEEKELLHGVSMEVGSGETTIKGRRLIVC